MEMWMDVDAAITVPVNIMPLLDDADFKTRETGVAYNAGGMDLVWNFVKTDGTITQTAVTPTTGGDYDWSHVGDGMYKIEIPASGGASINNDQEGFGWFTGIATGILPWRGPVIGFRAAALNNDLVDAGEALAKSAALGTVDDLVDTLIARLTAARAGYLDNLSGGAVALEATLAVVDALIDAIKSKTDNIPAVPAAVGSAMTLEAAYDAAKSAASQASVNAIPTTPLLTNDSRLNNLDAAISSRLASSGYTAPPTVGEIATAVWENTTRTLSSFGTLVASIWTYVTRTLTSAGAGGATAEEVWTYADRTVTGQSADVEVTGPVASGGGISIIAGDDYYDADGRALEWSSSAWPDLTGASVAFVTGDTEIAMSVVTGGSGEQTVRLELSKVQSVALKGSFTFDVEAVLDGESAHEVTLVRAAGVCG